MTKLHLGCSNAYPGPLKDWDNLDIHPWTPDIILHDLREPLKYKKDSVEAIFTCHVLEHLTRKEGRRLLKECFRVLKKGFPIRVIVPDLRIILKQKKLKNIVKDLYDADSKSGQHKYMYYSESLIDTLEQLGFSNVKEVSYKNNQSEYEVYHGIQNFIVESLCVEGIK